MAAFGFNVNQPPRIYDVGAFGNTPRAVMDTPGIFSLDPNEGPAPSSTPAPAGRTSTDGGFLGTLRDLLPSIINAGAAWYGNKNAAGQYQAAANQSTGKPVNIQSLFGGLAYNPETGIQLTQGQPVGPWAGASPELIGAFNQLNDQGAIQQEAGGRLDLLRQLAAPEEARATQNLQQQLFSQGRLGGTGGAVQQEALARAQGQADLERTLASQDWARNNALQRFNAATGVIGSGQAQRGLDVNTALGLGQLGVQAGRPPASDLLAAMAGSKDAQLRSIFGALGGNDEGGIGGVLGDLLKGVGIGGAKDNSTLNLLGGLASGFGQNVGGNLGAGLGGIGSILNGLGSGNLGSTVGGLGGLLGSIGGALGSDSKTGGILSGFGNILGGMAGGGAAGGGSAGNALGFLGSLGGVTGGGNPLGILSSLGSLGGGASGALGSLGGAASGTLGSLGSIGAALGPVAGIAAGLVGIPKLFQSLGFGGKMPPGTSAFVSPEKWDVSQSASWGPQEWSAYNRAVANAGKPRTDTTYSRSRGYWNTPGATMPSNGII